MTMGDHCVTQLFSDVSVRFACGGCCKAVHVCICESTVDSGGETR
jgi:hypothetical protein